MPPTSTTTPRFTLRDQSIRIAPDSGRVIARMMRLPDQRMNNIIDRVLLIPEEEVPGLLMTILNDFGKRHKKLESVWLRNYYVAFEILQRTDAVSEDRKILIGAYLTMEYSVESAALFNPSIVPHPDQSGLSEGHLRAIISLRALGEGHISSIEFRSAILSQENRVTIEPFGRFVAPAVVHPDRSYDKHLFFKKLFDMTLTWEPSALDIALQVASNDIVEVVMNRLGETFNLDELRQIVNDLRCEYTDGQLDLLEEVYGRMVLLAHSNYEIHFPVDSELAERVIFPVSHYEANGIEDARFVEFMDDDNTVTYYATYTAYDGKRILTQFLETSDFRRFRVHTLNGRFSQSKGMALFPRKIGGRYAMVSRIDGESLYIMYSDNLHFWEVADKLQLPLYHWELTQIGNCGSPVETDKGWILLTHGVGPMRRYSIGVMLLDLEDPSKVIAQLPDPILSPSEDEREGYVPNVVYSCGSLIHNDQLVIPYAVSDTSSRVATLPLSELLAALEERANQMREEA